MGKTLREIAEELRSSSKKVQLIYAFNGVGKTRLSREFKEVVDPQNNEEQEQTRKVLYYNAFTEDLFVWENNSDGEHSRQIGIQPNEFTKWIFEVQGQENNIVRDFQHYTSDKLTPKFSEDFSKISFSIETGDDHSVSDIKISRGEESCLIWCIFFSVLKQAIDARGQIDETLRETKQFDNLEYVFIDDPVSSLDENHLIELAFDLASQIKRLSNNDIRFIITTHNPLFYNILWNEMSGAARYRLEKENDGTYKLERQSNDSPLSYHIYLLTELQNAIDNYTMTKVHFNYLRQILEKTSTFLGYENWEQLLPNGPKDSPDAYVKRIIDFSSHDKQSSDGTYYLEEREKAILKRLVDHLITTYHFNNHSTQANNNV